MKEYFSHDLSSRNDPKIQNLMMDHGMEGVGVFWCLVEMLYEQGGALRMDQIKAIAWGLHAEQSLVESVVKNYSLFDTDGEVFWSPSARKRSKEREEVSEKNRQNVMRRWNAKNADKPKEKDTKKTEETNDDNTTVEENNTTVLRPSAARNTIKEKKIKENNISTPNVVDIEQQQQKQQQKQQSEAKKENLPSAPKREEEEEYFKNMLSYWNKVVKETEGTRMKQVWTLNDKRRNLLRNVCSKYPLQLYARAVHNAMINPYLNGRTKRRDKPGDFDWCMQEDHFVKLIEGNV